MEKPYKPLARIEGLVVQEMPDELLVYDVSSERAHCLNSSAASVWKACDGATSVAEIATAMKSEEGVVWLALEQLQENELMQERFEPAASGTSRRDLLRTVGLAAAALPLVASLAAPRSAMAAASCTCVSPGDCLAQTSCPSSVNCNGSGVCAP